MSTTFIRAVGMTVLIVALGLACLLVVKNGFVRGIRGSRPNIILIVVDTLRTDYLGCYGFRGPISPEIDKLADKSVLFSRCIAQAPWTKPSAASIITSLHPQTHRVTEHHDMAWPALGAEYKTDILPEEAVTLAEALSLAGYRTAGFGENWWLAREYGFAQGYENYEMGKKEKLIWEHNADAMTSRIKRWLQSLEDQENFFLYIHYMDVHGPYLSTVEDRKALNDSPSLGQDRPLNPTERRRINPYLKPRHEAFDSLKAWKTSYAGGVRNFDRRLGGILSYLEDSGHMQGAVLVLTSDHGEELCEHGAWNHGYSLHGHEISVPLLIRLPGDEMGGSRVEGLTSLLDIMPTLLSLAGVRNKPTAMEGQDLSPLLFGQDLKLSEWSFSSAVAQNPMIPDQGDVSGYVSVQNTDHKLIWNFPNGQPALYDLNSDPDEQEDVSSDNPDLAASLARVLSRHVIDLGEKGSLLRTQESMSPEEVERLRSLGYLR